MKSRWNEDAAQAFDEPLALRAYTSRLLGQEPDLVLHGGGNTSLKTTVRDFVGDEVPVLWVKGSGHDLATIGPAGFAPVRMRTLLAMGARDALSDSDMVKEQRAAMLDPDAPVPSIEAVLHALIPAPWVDHTHADAVVAISNTPMGAERLLSIYGERVLFVPYVMPGFELAKEVQRILSEVDASRYEGMVLLHHGVFTWGASARESYERMIRLVDDAEKALVRYRAWDVLARTEPTGSVDAIDPAELGTLRLAVGRVAGQAMVARVDASPEALGFASLPGVAELATRGPLTPDHVIRTKCVPLVIAGGADVTAEVHRYAEAYRAYFARNAGPDDHPLDPAPRWIVWPGQGLVAFGRNVGEAEIVLDIARHTIAAIQRAEAMGGWKALPERDLYRMEYWELEQRKLRRPSGRPELEGQVAVVSGAAHGIGRAVAARLRELGASVVGLDRDPAVTRGSDRGSLGLVCDVTDRRAVDDALSTAVRRFGGVDLLVSNAGSFPEGAPISELSDERWADTLALNLDAHLKVLRASAAHLARGFHPAVVVVASKNVAAPGPGVAAYSVAKAGLTQLARVAALELGEDGVRVNVVHPDAVFDTMLWSAGKLEARAKSYGLTVDEYKRRNILKREVRARDVAVAVARLLSQEFSVTTGAQIAIDGGNPRVI